MLPITHNLDAKGCLNISLNRPERGNALNETSVELLNTILDDAAHDTTVRCVVLQANGKHFCTGVDLAWMARCASMPLAENLDAAQRLSQCFYKLSTLPTPTICVAHGRVMGGGVGLVACCDIALAATQTEFCLPELQLNLIPAIIMPYLISAIGKRRAQTYALTSKSWDCKQACIDGLIHHSMDIDALPEYLDTICTTLFNHAPDIIRRFKRCVVQHDSGEENLQQTGAVHLAECRALLEAQQALAPWMLK